MERQDRLAEIARRWKGARAVEQWRALSSAQRQAVLGEFEESQRALQESQPALASHISTALDVLDVAATEGALGLWAQATEDVTWLLDEVERLRKQGAR